MARRYIDSGAKFTRRDLVLVNMEYEGTVTESLSPRRLFPTSDREHYISLLDSDGHEIAILRDLSLLDAESADVIRNALSEYYIIPEITAVLFIEEKGGTDRWTVMTDRGECSFQIRSRITDVKALDDGRILFRDSSDNRYEIRDWTKLDKHSRHLLNAYT